MASTANAAAPTTVSTPPERSKPGSDSARGHSEVPRRSSRFQSPPPARRRSSEAGTPEPEHPRSRCQFQDSVGDVPDFGNVDTSASKAVASRLRSGTRGARISGVYPGLARLRVRREWSAWPARPLQPSGVAVLGRRRLALLVLDLVFDFVGDAAFGPRGARGTGARRFVPLHCRGRARSWPRSVRFGTVFPPPMTHLPRPTTVTAPIAGRIGRTSAAVDDQHVPVKLHEVGAAERGFHFGDPVVEQRHQVVVADIAGHYEQQLHRRP